MDIRSERLSVGDLFRTGWSLYRGNFKNILLVILCVYFPVNLIIVLIPDDLVYAIFEERGFQVYTQICQLLQLLIGSIATIGVSAIVEKSLQETSLGWGPALRCGLSRWGAVVGTQIVAGLIVGGLSLLLIIPGIIWSVYYAFGTYVAALRGLSGKEALDYSKSLVKGHWWRTAGIILLSGGLSSIAALVIVFLFAFISVNPIFTILPYTLSDIVAAFFTVISVEFFLNMDYLRNPVTVQAEAPTLLPQA